jgi:hypothetical protein
VDPGRGCQHRRCTPQIRRVNIVDHVSTYSSSTIWSEYLSYEYCITYFPLCTCLILVEDRKLIESQIRSHGGIYHPDLSRHCTYLLCASASGKKYEAALKWGLNCVGVEWLFQSIERGMALDPKYYSLDIEPEKRGEGAWDREALLKASGLSGMALDKVVPMEFEGGGRKRRLRRAGSKMAQEVWDGILGGVIEQAEDIVHIRATDEVSMQSLQIADDAGNDALGMDFDPSKGIFDGMTFYTSGFNDKQVFLSRNISHALEKSSHRCDNQKCRVSIH